jgi:hypothetical protein
MRCVIWCDVGVAAADVLLQLLLGLLPVVALLLRARLHCCQCCTARRCQCCTARRCALRAVCQPLLSTPLACSLWCAS